MRANSETQEKIILLGFPLVLGIFLHLTMPEPEYDIYAKAVSLYGLVIFSGYLFGGIINERILSGLSAPLLLMIALLVLLDTFIPASDYRNFFPVHSSYYFSGMIGLLGAIQVIAILRDFRIETDIKRFAAKIAAHAGILIILCAGAMGNAFGMQGILTLYENSESEVFAVTGGPEQEMTGETGYIEGCNLVRDRSVSKDQPYKVYNVYCTPGFNTAVFGMFLLIIGTVITGFFYRRKKS
jgi:hypothetical protein